MHSELKSWTVSTVRVLAKQSLRTMAMAGALAAGLATPATAQLSESDILIYQAAFEAGGLGAWDSARQIVGQATDPVLAPVLDWVAMSNDDGDRSFAEIAAFIQRYPDWPDRTGLQAQAEHLMPRSISAADAVAWFETYPPVTVDGIVRYGESLLALDREAEAAAMVRAAWVDFTMSAPGQEEVLASLSALLRPEDHWARLDNLVWAGRETEARLVMPLVGPGYRALAEARLQLAGRERGVDTLIDQVPAELLSDEGLLFERMRWRRRNGLIDGAIEILAQAPLSANHGRDWWRERSIIARNLFNAGDYARAYQVAAGNQQTDSFAYSQAQWFAGWIAPPFPERPAARA